MGNIKEGTERIRFCYECLDMREMTATKTDVPFSDNSGVVKDILVYVCNTCFNIGSILAENKAKIREEYNKRNL